ncbi:hypothetical protein JDV02_009987 [Purpureocillium takamizusanense]|uniref:Uncharacterized protein n=1 Tax=Purpureocillium takamizusanense TaxID=2060973 RepID=A0A9Q8QS19_9HYPO|nr:uncharacterized protein JDV02_009987 [Purpureocillium takamizusanense]UNI24221.1 hypothetical protein JDV02_009987 [Purpureocillium takamizusanense]
MAVMPLPANNNASSSSSPTPASAASTPAPQQPTYTTAGTIYNPNSSQPLQPPARRGRSTKWNVGVNQTELCLFPKAVLAGLTMKAVANGRASTGMQQYAPLQQNSDRAVSPLSTSEHGSMGIALPSQTPRLNTGNHSTTQTHSLAQKENVNASETTKERLDNTVDGDGNGLVGSTTEQHAEEADDDHAGPPAHLLSMSINGLKSLASYPNPCQKDAQKLLKPTVDLAAPKALTAPVLGFPAAGTQKVPPKDEVTGVRGPPGLTLLRPSHIDGVSNVTATQNKLFPISMTRSPSPASGLENVMTPPSSASASSTRSGPAPLTAGPPGQRQYRPLAYDSMVKTFQSGLETMEQPLEYVEGTGNSNNASAGAEMVDSGLGANIPRAYSLPETFTTASLIQTPPPSSEAVCSDEPSEPKKKSLLAELVETSEPDGSPVRNNTGISAYVDGPAWDQGYDYAAYYAQARQRYGGGYYLSSVDASGQRGSIWNDSQLRTERGWYAGSHLLGKTMEEIVAEENYRKRRCVFGAIGDGRPKPSGKKEYPRISIEEANSITTPEHAEPLLRMMYGSLLQAVEEGKLGTEFYKWAEEQDKKYDGKVSVGKTAAKEHIEVEAE